MVSTAKVIVVAILASLVLFLGSGVITLTIILEKRKSLAKQRKLSNGQEDQNTAEGELATSKTVEPSLPVPVEELNLRQTSYAPHETGEQTAADSHFGKALRLIPFESEGGEGGNAYPPPVRYTEFHQEARGADFVKTRKERRRGKKSRKAQNRRIANQTNRPDGGDSSTVSLPAAIADFLGLDMEGSPLSGGIDWINSLLDRVASVIGTQNPVQSDWENVSGGDQEETDSDDDDTDYQRNLEAEEALFHLEQASELGNPYAQNMVANALASGVLPVDNSVQLPANSSLAVPASFTDGGEQLASALLLWHMSAMDGVIESAMALGYRHWYSATGAGNDNSIVTEADTKHRGVGNTHSAAPSSHYGLLGTCESALAYYEAAANAIMDEMESSELRGKVSPSIDKHRLAEIHMHGGASSALAHYNKPDELEEALQYYRIRASPSHQPEPDVNAAYTLANFYHYGMRGVKQDMKLALKYYSIAADNGSWEAAGQAGKFHFWGLGLEEHERDLVKAYEYFKLGAPGGHEGCLKRFQDKRKTRKQNVQPWDEDDDDDPGALCDHPCVNGLGLLTLFGVPGLLPANPEKAKKLFVLSRDMGNMDASYNLGMMRLGWMTEEYVDEEQEEDDEDSPKDIEDIIEEFLDEMDKEAEEDETFLHDDKVSVSIKKVFSVKPAKSMIGDDKTSVQNLALAAAKAVSKETEKFEESLSGKKGKEQSTSGQRKTKYRGPSKQDYQMALSDFVNAATKGHMQAKHRLAMLLSKGVTIPKYRNNGDKVVAVDKSCSKALKYYMQIADGGPTIARRTRAAYKQYIAGDYESSLRNYLAAAETGSEIGQINAAFLLERGHCLGMTEDQCSRASVRLWRAAAKQGNAEACLRVGDFYYYGRMRKHSDASSSESGKAFSLGPFMWTHYVLYPEELLPLVKSNMVRGVRWILSKTTGRDQSGRRSHGQDELLRESANPKACSPDDSESSGTCVIQDNQKPEDEKDKHSDVQADLSTAAQYYRLAAEMHSSARANFNLGFMHEWGLGLTQDFPLAKRHYDLAGNHKSGELAVKISLMSMNLHEKIVRFHLAFGEWLEESGWDEWLDGIVNGQDVSPSISSSSSSPSEQSANTPMVAEITGGGAGHPVPGGPQTRIAGRTSKADVILSHILSWESLLIIVLTIVLSSLIHRRFTRLGIPP